MWKPPERIKFETAVARWPSAEEAAGSRLYSPLDDPQFRIGPADLGARNGAVAGE